MALILIGGGARSGKSSFAVHRALAAGPSRLFIATARAYDEEMEARIAAHRAERSDAFRTIEAPVDLHAALDSAIAERPDAIVIDCLTLWMSNLLLDEQPPSAILDRALEIGKAATAAPVPILVVTNEVGMGVVPMSALGRTFRDVAGSAHQRLSSVADEVWFAVMGLMLRLVPGPLEAVPASTFRP
ncbi:MAG: bifunctional adenosylcobinamide kinase/adenosylcobinamide-phosphate guanylyltransferase [Myxococcota bacterium]